MERFARNTFSTSHTLSRDPVSGMYNIAEVSANGRAFKRDGISEIKWGMVIGQAGLMTGKIALTG